MRDRLLRRPTRDVDLDVVGLDEAGLVGVLERFGDVLRFGRAFPVHRVRGIDADIALAPVEGAPALLGEADRERAFAAASRRRDLRIDSIGWDPVSGRLLDPHGGIADLRRGVLRATDPARFGEDPLRGLRVAELAARFEMEPDAELRALCAALSLADVAGERLLEEFRKLLLRARRPSRGLAFLEETELLRFFPELAALVGVPQDPEWHPEGDVWVHTRLAVDAATALREGEVARDLALGFATLCHDLGKPATTQEEGGRIRSRGHDRAGEEPTRAFLERLRAPTALVRTVVALVRHHLAPALFVGQGASDRAYRRLARRLAAAGADMELLERVARADHLGRTTADARAGRFDPGDAFRERARALGAERRPPPPVVRGRDVLRRGIAPGPAVGRVLARCRDVQDATGWTDPDAILDHALAQEPEPGSEG